jgi:hypothetical protein
VMVEWEQGRKITLHGNEKQHTSSKAKTSSLAGLGWLWNGAWTSILEPRVPCTAIAAGATT